MHQLEGRLLTLVKCTYIEITTFKTLDFLSLQNVSLYFFFSIRSLSQTTTGLISANGDCFCHSRCYINGMT